ncbi:MAG TPA: c-type cytochrome [Vicinamibacteria bacterium]|nr:c-type cytochrome [Vicinamibacteria bacterium]
MNSSRVVVTAALAVAVMACTASPKSAAGFRLPNGDADRGQAAFVGLRCNGCHRVAGLDLGQPTAVPSVPVVLGGEVPHVKTDGELVTSIIAPSHRVPEDLPADLVRRAGGSRMPDYSDVMTVRQMVDLVAFLQSRYRVVRPGAGQQ